MDVKLKITNNSKDATNSKNLIFEKNVATNFDELAIAWKVIEYCGQGDNHPFTFPIGLQVSASDSYGNYTPQPAPQNGQLFQMSPTSSGYRLVPADNGTSSKEVLVLNKLPKGAINANIYMDGKLLAIKTSIEPK